MTTYTTNGLTLNAYLPNGQVLSIPATQLGQSDWPTFEVQPAYGDGWRPGSDEVPTDAATFALAYHRCRSVLDSAASELGLSVPGPTVTLVPEA